MILIPLQKLPKNVVDLGKIIGAKGFKSCPKSNKLPYLVTLHYLSYVYAVYVYLDSLDPKLHELCIWPTTYICHWSRKQIMCTFPTLF